MYFNHLIAENFRNITFAAVEFQKGINVLCGANAAGKTNALEAIYLFAAGKSFRTAKEKEFIRHGEKCAQINIGFTQDRTPDKTERMMIRYFGGGVKARKQLKFNGIDISRASDFLGLFRAVLFTPDHLSLVKGSPEERRRFIDIALCQIRPRYIYCLNEYARILDQRNAFLRSAQSRGGAYDGTLLDVINQQLARTAAIITKQRHGFCKGLRKFAGESYSHLTNDTETLCIQYVGGARCDYDDAEEVKNKYLSLYENNVKNEVRVGGTLYGPHRDEAMIYIGSGGECDYERNSEAKAATEYPARSFGSQGQQRSAVLALKLAEGEMFRELTGEYPLFLLDDLFSELDKNRREYLLRTLRGRQAVITCCEEKTFRGAKNINLIRVKNGEFE